jgi:hypothetical protein
MEESDFKQEYGQKRESTTNWQKKNSMRKTTVTENPKKLEYLLICHTKKHVA